VRPKLRTVRRLSDALDVRYSEVDELREVYDTASIEDLNRETMRLIRVSAPLAVETMIRFAYGDPAGASKAPSAAMQKRARRDVIKRKFATAEELDAVPMTELIERKRRALLAMGYGELPDEDDLHG